MVLVLLWVVCGRCVEFAVVWLRGLGVIVLCLVVLWVLGGCRLCICFV